MGIHIILQRRGRTATLSINFNKINNGSADFYDAYWTGACAGATRNRPGGPGHNPVCEIAWRLMTLSARALATVVAAVITSPALHAQQALLTVRPNPDQREIIFEIGPLHLEANAGHGEVSQPKAQAIALPLGGFLHGFTTEMIDADGRRIPSELLHHVNIIAPQRRELFSEIMQRVGAAGSETGPVVVPKFLGYPVNRGDSLLFTAMFHNPTGTSYHDARLRIRMRYSTERIWHPRLSVQPFYLDVMPPAGGHAYDLPPGRSSRSWQGKPAINGRILAMGGHLHKYGIALKLEDMTEGKVVFETKPEFDQSGNVKAMPKKYFLWRLGIPMQADHTYRLTATYDNPTGQTLVGGGMGALGGVFAPSVAEQWPVVNRQHPEYQYDVKVTYEGSHGGGHGGGHDRQHGH
jgi:hypothetical protein